MCASLLWSRILCSPLFSIFGDGDVCLLDLRYSFRYGHMCTRLPDMCPESDNLVQDHFPHLLDVFNDLECEVKGLWASWLVGGVMPDVEIAMLKGLFYRDARGWVESKHTIEEVEGIWVGLWKESLEGDLGHERQVADVLLCSW